MATLAEELGNAFSRTSTTGQMWNRGVFFRVNHGMGLMTANLFSDLLLLQPTRAVHIDRVERSAVQQLLVRLVVSKLLLEALVKLVNQLRTPIYCVCA